MEKRAFIFPEPLVEKARLLEDWSYNPDGKRVDGTVYTASSPAIQFFREVYLFVGNGSSREGYRIIQEEVRRLGGNPDCGNWHLTAALSLGGIPLRTE